jgi:hypothetical protein
MCLLWSKTAQINLFGALLVCLVPVPAMVLRRVRCLLQQWLGWLVMHLLCVFGGAKFQSRCRPEPNPATAIRRDEDMTPTNTTIDYKVRSFLHLHSNFGYNSLGSTCRYRYLNVGTNVSQSGSPSKLNFRFVGSPIVLHWKGHNSSIRSAIEVNEHLMAFK